MDRNGRQFLTGAAILGFAINLTWIGPQACGQLLVTKALAEGAAANCVEFWFSRYQSLIAGIIALIGAWLTVMAMRHQTEAARGDVALTRLSAYSAGIARIMRRFTTIEPRDPTGPDSDARTAKVTALRDTIDDPTIQQALTDPLLGGDSDALGLFMSLVIGAALYPQAGDLANRNIGQLVWPLYMDLTNNLAKRRQMIIAGKPTSHLFKMARINQQKYRDGYVSGSVVVPDDQ